MKEQIQEERMTFKFRNTQNSLIKIWILVFCLFGGLVWFGVVFLWGKNLEAWD